MIGLNPNTGNTRDKSLCVMSVVNPGQPLKGLVPAPTIMSGGYGYTSYHCRSVGSIRDHPRKDGVLWLAGDPVHWRDIGTDEFDDSRYENTCGVDSNKPLSVFKDYVNLYTSVHLGEDVLEDGWLADGRAPSDLDAVTSDAQSTPRREVNISSGETMHVTISSGDASMRSVLLASPPDVVSGVEDLHSTAQGSLGDELTAASLALDGGGDLEPLSPVRSPSPSNSESDRSRSPPSPEFPDEVFESRSPDVSENNSGSDRAADVSLAETSEVVTSTSEAAAVAEEVDEDPQVRRSRLFQELRNQIAIFFLEVSIRNHVEYIS